MSDPDQRYPNPRAAGALGELERGRKCHERRAWADAYQSLSLADQAASLEAEHLELLAMSAYMIVATTNI